MTDAIDRFEPLKPAPRLHLYSKPGCHLCEQARLLIDAITRRRAAAGKSTPIVEERNILADPAWEKAFFLDIPVLEVGDRRLLLAVDPGRIEAFLADVLGA